MPELLPGRARPSGPGGSSRSAAAVSNVMAGCVPGHPGPARCHCTRPDFCVTLLRHSSAPDLNAVDTFRFPVYAMLVSVVLIVWWAIP